MLGKLLTIIIPSYNMELYLPKCLQSLIIDNGDLLRKLDVVIVNDGSKDRTSIIAHEFEARHPGVFRVIDKANGHYGSCVNAGLSVADGTYVKILDADDSFESNALSSYLEYLQSLEGDVDMIVTDFCSVDTSGREMGRITHKFPVAKAFGIESLMSHPQVVVMHAITYRTDMLRNINYTQTEGMLYTDGEWCFTPMMHVKDIRYCPVVLYRYLIGRDGQSVATYGRNVLMQVHLLKYMVDTYRKNAMTTSADCRRYLERYIKHIATISYSTYFFKCPIRTVNVGVSDVDQYLKQNMPDVYLGLEDLSILSNTIFRYRYLQRWRRRGKLPWIELCALQMYMRYIPRLSRLSRI